MSTQRVRSRNLINEQLRCNNRGSIVGDRINIVSTHVVDQTTVDEETAWMYAQRRIKEDPDTYSVRRLKRLDLGCDFRSTKLTLHKTANKSYSDTFVGQRSGQNFYFTGSCFPRLSSLTVGEGRTGPVFSESDATSLVSAGSTAVAKTVPTSPASNAATFTGELLRDGIPSHIGKQLLRDRAHFFRSLGSEYLNVEFGWKPFISDLRKFFVSVRDSHKILAQYERDAGKVIRRRYEFPTLESSTQLYAPRQIQVDPTGPSNMYADATGYGMQHGERITRKSIWFSGAYTYYLARGDEHRKKMARLAQEADRLLGTRITPEVLWELAPWSWAIDWITNFGEIFTNLTRFSEDGLVMKYGYVMGDFTMTDRHFTTGCTWRDGTSSGDARVVWENRTKLRVHATPWGFGLDPSTDFTARQWSILVALGLSKNHRVSW